MKLNSTSIHVGCKTFCGNGCNLNDPSETVLIARLPYLTPNKEKQLIDMVFPVIVGFVKQVEEGEENKE